MRVILVISIAMLLSGCMVTETIDNNSPTLVRSSSSQRVGILIPDSVNAKYCPDAPADTAKTFDGTIAAALTDKLGSSITTDASLKTAIVDLAKRNTTTNVLVYSLNSLCFLSMNGVLNASEVATRFDAVLKVVSDIAEEDKKTAEKEKSEAELTLRKFNLRNNIIDR
ncbi:hypothetical protein [Pectobacterium carotovorum]|uniref:hypothetical protein n=1 Tax=Pectobacterium carotovorum TaxID=554 RepID=UPI0010FDB6C8|nr:hypothetical protein [Pectobacterium carotovorum]KAA3665726.1 hypothetical protein FEV48_20755 [Pectobacterium carotovorum subsp. carotovorum]MBA0175447.1 hypothetical protein [Pectobacterium carotovorum]UCZ79954.1 hypothetical protein LHL03_02020 [Pectobacterium carotovorum]